MNINRLVIAALALGACTPSAAPPLQGAAIGGPFTLVAEDGRTVTDAAFAGKYRIVYFGYTSCPDVCPTEMANLMNGVRAFAKTDPMRAAKIVSLFISVDPARDTPKALREFTANFHPDLIGLTGSAAQIAVVTKEFGVAYSYGPATAPGQYRVDHSNATFLMDPDGKPLKLLSSTGTASEIAGELGAWVR
jgi:protein SCO1